MDTDFMTVTLRVCDSKLEWKKPTSHNVTGRTISLKPGLIRARALSS